MSGTLSPLFSWRSQIAKSDLPAPARHIALTLALFMNEMGTSCWPSITKQCEATGLSRSTVCKHLELLEEKGWLGRKRGAKGRSTHYVAQIPSEGEVVRLADYGLNETVREVNGGSPSDGHELVTYHVKELRPSPATTSKEARDSVWDALEAIFQPPTTPQHRKRFGKVQKELLADTSLTPSQVASEIPLRASRYRQKWPDADLTLEAFAKHWPDLRNGNGSISDSPLPVLPDGEQF